MNDHIRAGHGGAERGRGTEVRLHGTDGRGVQQVVGEWPPVNHQPQNMPIRHEMASEKAAKVSSGTGDQNRAMILHLGA